MDHPPSEEVKAHIQRALLEQEESRRAKVHADESKFHRVVNHAIATMLVPYDLRVPEQQQGVHERLAALPPPGTRMTFDASGPMACLDETERNQWAKHNKVPFLPAPTFLSADANSALTQEARSAIKCCQEFQGQLNKYITAIANVASGLLEAEAADICEQARNEANGDEGAVQAAQNELNARDEHLLMFSRAEWAKQTLKQRLEKEGQSAHNPVLIQTAQLLDTLIVMLKAQNHWAKRIGKLAVPKWGQQVDAQHDMALDAQPLFQQTLEQAMDRSFDMSTAGASAQQTRKRAARNAVRRGFKFQRHFSRTPPRNSPQAGGQQRGDTEPSQQSSHQPPRGRGHSNFRGRGRGGGRGRGQWNP